MTKIGSLLLCLLILLGIELHTDPGQAASPVEPKSEGMAALARCWDIQGVIRKLVDQGADSTPDEIFTAALGSPVLSTCGQVKKINQDAQRIVVESFTADCPQQREAADKIRKENPGIKSKQLYGALATAIHVGMIDCEKYSLLQYESLALQQKIKKQDRTKGAASERLQEPANAPETAVAGSFDDAFSAYQQGDYATAFRLLRPLANKGDARAENNLGNLYLSVCPESC